MKTNHTDRPILFHETQKFRQPWLWAIILLPMGFLLGSLVYPEVLGDEAGGEAVPFVVILLFNALMALVILGFARAGLTTSVDEQGLNYGWNLFGSKLKQVAWNDVRTLSLIKYRFVGYGIRLSVAYGTVHNVSGNIGLLVERKRGGKFMIGTNRPEELDDAIRKVIEAYPHITYSSLLDAEGSPRLSS